MTEATDAKTLYAARLEERLTATGCFLKAVTQAIEAGDWIAAKQSTQALLSSAAQVAENVSVLEFIHWVERGHYKSVRRRKR